MFTILSRFLFEFMIAIFVFWGDTLCLDLSDFCIQLLDFPNPLNQILREIEILLVNAMIRMNAMILIDDRNGYFWYFWDTIYCSIAYGRYTLIAPFRILGLIAVLCNIRKLVLHITLIKQIDVQIQFLVASPLNINICRFHDFFDYRIIRFILCCWNLY